jgi:hypothetical protein
MHELIVFALLLAWPQSADKKDQPLASATNPTYLSCTVWTDKEWSKPASRSARTPVKQSTKGFRAYGEVAVSVNGEDCENTTTLFVALPDSKEFKPVYTTSEGGGNGIRLLDWSPSGDRLLAEVTFWTYESDIGFGYIPVIYDASTNSAKELRSMDKALVQHLGSDCSFEDHVRGWKTDQRLLVRVSPDPSTEEDEDHSCVAQPRFFVYDIQRDTLQAVQSNPKPK